MRHAGRGGQVRERGPAGQDVVAVSPLSLTCLETRHWITPECLA
jgi:hypothetical protein